MSTQGVQGITEQDIANYLANTPAFFERHAELMSTIQLTSPHGQRAVSLQERQMEMLREKIKGLEGKIIEMIRHGQENLVYSEKLHRWTRALMQVQDPGELPDVLARELAHQYMIPQTGIRVWGVNEAYAGKPFAQGVSDDAKTFTSSLSVPYCGVNSGFEAVRWLEEPATAMSMAMIPLRDTGDTAAFGLLVLASPDATRYTADMGTEFLVRVGEIASSALSRLRPRG